MIASGVLSLAGLSGVAVGNMQVRNIGIVGYVGVFLVVAVLLTILFYRAKPKSEAVVGRGSFGTSHPSIPSGAREGNSPEL